MKSIKIIMAILSLGLAGSAIALLVTNPKQAAYEDYAVAQLQTQLSEDVCEEAPSFFEEPCNSLIENNDGLLKTMVNSSTIRRNYYIFSLYETDLEPMAIISELLPGNLSLSVGDVQGVPTYHAKTVGVLGRFVTYKTEKRQ